MKDSDKGKKNKDKKKFDHTTDEERKAALLTDFPKGEIMVARKVADDLTKREKRNARFNMLRNNGLWAPIVEKFGLERALKMRIFTAASLLTNYVSPSTKAAGVPDLADRIRVLQDLITDLALQLGESLPITRVIQDQRASTSSPATH